MTDNENKPAAALCAHVWFDYGQLGGRNVTWCPHCDTLAWTGKEPEPSKPKASAVPEAIDTAELATELERQWLAKTIADMRRHADQNMMVCPFLSGWEMALEEIEARCAAPSAPQAEEAPAGISSQDLVAERHKDPRKAVALDRVKDAHSAAATPERAQPSIADDPEFRAMYLTCAGTLLWTEEGYLQNAAFVDAKLIKAKKAGYFEAIMDSIEKLRDLDLDKSE